MNSVINILAKNPEGSNCKSRMNHLLTKDEKNYLFKYHLEVYSRISKYLNPKEKSWLATFI